MADLLPCPFCGGAPEMRPKKQTTRSWQWVECTACGAKGPAHFMPHEGTPDEAWNRRKQSSPIAETESGK